MRNALCRLNRLPMKHRQSDDDDDDDDALMPAFQSLVQKRMVETFCPGKEKRLETYSLFWRHKKEKSGDARSMFSRAKFLVSCPSSAASAYR